MAAIIGDLPGRPSTLALHSCQAQQIDNGRCYEVTIQEAKAIRDLDKQYGATVDRRGEPTPVFNCHGLTFAARRTAIDATPLPQILREDDYQEVVSENDVLEGDVIMYLDPESGDFEHSGIVVGRPNRQILGRPLVCSKWGKYAEVIHYANNCPYDSSSLKYYRIRS